MLVQHMAALNNGKRIVLASGSPRRREILTMLGTLAPRSGGPAAPGRPRRWRLRCLVWCQPVSRRPSVDCSHPLSPVVWVCLYPLPATAPRPPRAARPAGLAHEVHASAFEENLDKGAFPTPAEYAKTNASSKAAAVVAELAAGGGAGRCPDLVIGSDTIVVVDGRILEKPRSEAAAYEMLATLRCVDVAGRLDGLWGGGAHLHSYLRWVGWGGAGAQGGPTRWACMLWDGSRSADY